MQRLKFILLHSTFILKYKWKEMKLLALERTTEKAALFLERKQMILLLLVRADSIIKGL